VLRRLRVVKSGDVNGDDVPLEMLNTEVSPLPSSLAPGAASAMADEGRGAVGSIGSAAMFESDLESFDVIEIEGSEDSSSEVKLNS
jgi:hypothetical protein